MNRKEIFQKLKELNLEHIESEQELNDIYLEAKLLGINIPKNSTDWHVQQLFETQILIMQRITDIESFIKLHEIDINKFRELMKFE